MQTRGPQSISRFNAQCQACMCFEVDRESAWGLRCRARCPQGVVCVVVTMDVCICRLTGWLQDGESMLGCMKFTCFKDES